MSPGVQLRPSSKARLFRKVIPDGGLLSPRWLDGEIFPKTEAGCFTCSFTRPLTQRLCQQRTRQNWKTRRLETRLAIRPHPPRPAIPSTQPPTHLSKRRRWQVMCWRAIFNISKWVPQITCNRKWVTLWFSGFPRWLSGKESTCWCRSYRRHGFDPWVGKIPWRRKGQSASVFLPGESHGERSQAGYSPWSHKESDMTEQLSTHTYNSLLEGSLLLKKKKAKLFLWGHHHWSRLIYSEI